MIRRRATAFLALAVAISLATWATPPSVGSLQSRTLSDSLSQWRFPVGERMEYSVSFGRVRLGTGTLSVEAIDTVRVGVVEEFDLSADGPIRPFDVKTEKLLELAVILVRISVFRLIQFEIRRRLTEQPEGRGR